MKKHLLLLPVLLSGLLVGCSTNKSKLPSHNQSQSVPSTANRTVAATSSSNVDKPTVPEPYTLALKQIRQGNLDLALQYLNLTIKNFPSNKQYVYDSNVLVSTILSSRLNMADIVVSSYSSGVNKGTVFFTSSDLTGLNHTINDVQKYVDQNYSQFKTSIAYINAHYQNDKSDVFSVSFVSPPDSTVQEAYQPIQWFSNVGTPIPTPDELSNYESIGTAYSFEGALNTLFKNDKMDIPAWFYYMGNFTSDNAQDSADRELAKETLELVLSNTTNDQYNEYRLKAQDALKNLS